MKAGIHLSKYDASNILKSYQSDALTVNYIQFLDKLCVKLDNERLQVTKDLFQAIQKNGLNQYSNNSNKKHAENEMIFYCDLIEMFDVECHPSVKCGRKSTEYINEEIRSALDSIGDENGHISYLRFCEYFRDICTAYPFNVPAYVHFIHCCWNKVFDNQSLKNHLTNQNVNGSGLKQHEIQAYIEQIEAVLAEKVRQKVRGNENESRTLLRCFKHFDLKNKNVVDYKHFIRTLESFGVIMPAQV